MAPTVFDDLTEKMSSPRNIKHHHFNESTSGRKYAQLRAAHKAGENRAQMVAILKKVKKSIPEYICAEELFDKRQSTSDDGDCATKHNDRMMDDMDRGQFEPRHSVEHDNSMDCEDEEPAACNSREHRSRSNSPLSADSYVSLRTHSEHQKQQQQPQSPLPSPQWSLSAGSPSSPPPSHLSSMEQPQTLGQSMRQHNLMQIALRTIKLLQRNRALQKKLAQLKIETSRFVSSVMANPANTETFRTIVIPKKRKSIHHQQHNTINDRN